MAKKVVYEYKLYCETCSAWQTVWSETVPTACPVSASHTITVSKTFVTCSTEQTLDLDFENRARVVPTSKSDPKTWSFFTSAGDHANGSLAAGNALQASLTTSASTSVEVIFREWVELHYGHIWYSNFEVGDSVDCAVTAPGTTTAAWSTGTKYSLHDLGDGNYCINEDVNGTLTIAGNPIPVEAFDAETWASEGFWNWDGLGLTIDHYTFVPDGNGQFNFYPNQLDMDLAWFAKNLRPLGTGQVTLQNEDSASIYPGYKIKMTLNNHRTDRTGTDALEVSVMLKLNRKSIR